MLNELYGVYDDPHEINVDELPDKFIINSGHTIIYTDKSKLNWQKTNKKLKYLRLIMPICQVWPYSDVKSKVVCERYLIDDTVSELMDYKIFCFNGEPEVIQVDMNRFSAHHRRNIYNLHWSIIAYDNIPSDTKNK